LLAPGREVRERLLRDRVDLRFAELAQAADAVSDADQRDTKMTETVGEHWVFATLARHHWAPAPTRDGLERTDILAVGPHLDHRPTVEIQVKKASQNPGVTKWVIGLRAQEFAKSAHEWFLLVLLPEFPSSPGGFVVPRDHVSAATWIVHQDWRTNPAVPEGQRNTGLDGARIALENWATYEDKWNLLDMPTTDVPVLLPSALRDLAQDERVGLPPGHPWNQELPMWK
jgi:hypothetical protein